MSELSNCFLIIVLLMLWKMMHLYHISACLPVCRLWYHLRQRLARPSSWVCDSCDRVTVLNWFKSCLSSLSCRVKCDDNFLFLCVPAYEVSQTSLIGHVHYASHYSHYIEWSRSPRCRLQTTREFSFHSSQLTELNFIENTPAAQKGE